MKILSLVSTNMDKIFENKNTNLSIKPRKSDIKVKIRLVLVYLAFYDSLFDECYRCPEDRILKWQCNDATKVRALLLFIEKKKRKREREKENLILKVLYS